jgi:hypothetical protein
MENNDHSVLTLEMAEFYTKYREMISIFNNFYVVTDIKFDALKYLVENKSHIALPNVKTLSKEKLDYLKNHEYNIILGIEESNE